MDKYVITGISRLTGERVVVSNTHSLSEAVEMRDRMAGKLHNHSAYKKLKVEPCNKEGSLW